MKKLLGVFGCFLMVGLSAFAQQSQTDMQNQMSAADQLQSAANTTLYKTPLKTYQQYYSAFSGGDFKSMAACYTDSFKNSEFAGHNPNDQDYANMATDFSQNGNTNYQLLSFIFTSNAQKPKITFIYSCSRAQSVVKEQLVLTLADTSSGWKIESIDDQEK